MKYKKSLATLLVANNATDNKQTKKKQINKYIHFLFSPHNGYKRSFFSHDTRIQKVNK